MNQPMKWVSGLVLTVFAVGSVGCGQGFRSSGGSASEGVQAVDISNQLKKAEEASALAEQAMLEANQAVSEITDEQGNIKVGLFSGTQTSEVEAQFILNGVITKLRETFDKVFDRVAQVKAQFTLARQKLAEAAALLEQNNPQHAAQIQEIMTQLARIDALEAKFSATMHQLAGKLDLAIVGLDKLISGATSFIPGWGWVIDLALDYFVMGDIKALVLELKTKLLSL